MKSQALHDAIYVTKEPNSKHKQDLEKLLKITDGDKILDLDNAWSFHKAVFQKMVQ